MITPLLIDALNSRHSHFLPLSLLHSLAVGLVHLQPKDDANTALFVPLQYLHHCSLAVGRVPRVLLNVHLKALVVVRFRRTEVINPVIVYVRPFLSTASHVSRLPAADLLPRLYVDVLLLHLLAVDGLPFVGSALLFPVGLLLYHVLGIALVLLAVHSIPMVQIYLIDLLLVLALPLATIRSLTILQSHLHRFQIQRVKKTQLGLHLVLGRCLTTIFYQSHHYHRHYLHLPLIQRIYQKKMRIDRHCVPQILYLYLPHPTHPPPRNQSRSLPCRIKHQFRASGLPKQDSLALKFSISLSK